MDFLADYGMGSLPHLILLECCLMKKLQCTPRIITEDYTRLDFYWAVAVGDFSEVREQIKSGVAVFTFSRKDLTKLKLWTNIVHESLIPS